MSATPTLSNRQMNLRREFLQKVQEMERRKLTSRSDPFTRYNLELEGFLATLVRSPKSNIDATASLDHKEVK